MSAEIIPNDGTKPVAPEGIGADGTITIHNVDHADNIFDEFESGNHIQKCLNDESAPAQYEQMESMNAILKTINAGIKDPFIRKVMSRRILGSAFTGVSQSHLAIAIALGAREHEVVEAEKIGIGLMQKIIEDSQFYIDKFNKDICVTR